MFRKTVQLARSKVRFNNVKAMSTLPLVFNNKTKDYKVCAGIALSVFTASVVVAEAKEKENQVDMKQVKSEISDIIEKDNAMGPTFLRLAWHGSGTYDKSDQSGGSNGGNIRHEPECGYGANAGLKLAIRELEIVKARNPNISYADLFILAGITAIEDMGGPSVPFQLGRTDSTSGASCTKDGRLPDADKGSKPATIQHIRDVFYRMGFNDRDIVALLGAHAVGRCYPTRSGYKGPWTRAEWTFSNEYFRELTENTWTIKKWNGPEQYEDPTKELMMLPADMALLWDPEFKKFVELYALDEDLWMKDFSNAFRKLTENNCNFHKSWYSFLQFWK